MSEKSEKKGLDFTTIIVAIIGLAGSIIAALITVNANKPSSTPEPQYPTVVVITATSVPSDTPIPTDTVAPGEPTSTPAPVTDTPMPTLTFTPVPPVELGKDWPLSCISALWRPYPANIPVLDNGNGCWKNPIQYFSATNGNLIFLAQRASNGPTEIYGLFAPLPASGSVSVHVHLTTLSNVDMLLGVYAEPDVASQGILMTIPSGNVRKRLIVQKDNVTNYTTLQQTDTLDQGDGFWFTFTFNDISASASVNPSVFVTNPVSISSPQKWFFIGYKGLNGTYQVDGNFFGLELK